jgi:Secretin and TonB N terminus short domain
MRWISGSGRRWAWALLIAASVLVTSERAASAQATGSGAELQFDIPTQPLASSLKTYSAVTNLELYYESSLMDGHRSPSLHGSFSPDVALRRLLEGTGFSVASFDPGTITILPPRLQAKGQELEAIKGKAAEFTSYFALIQAGLRSAFCRTPVIQTDLAELIVRLWIAPSGTVARADILSPTGSDVRDRAYAAAMRTLIIGESPPEGMPQPVTLMVLPRTSRMAAECPQPGASGPVPASAYE